MSGKAAGAYLTISEVSDKLDVPAHVLRFWETKFTQLKPLKRGGGRRYYREADVILLSRIRNLLYKDGFTIKGAQKALKSPDAGLQKDIAPLASEGRNSKTLSPKAEGMSDVQTDGSMTANAANESDSTLSELRAVLNQASDRIDALLAKLSR